MADNPQVLRTEAGTKLTREQKAGLVFVIVTGFGALILGGQYLWTHMAAPFVITYNGPRLLTGAEQESAEIAAQKKADTDLDNISDYDELNIYKTSPYLNDSDSDGLFDGAEIAAGQDPNCASGSACESSGFSSNEDIVTDSAAAALAAQGAELDARGKALEAAMLELQGLPPAEIRALLIQSGADQATIDGLTDEEVTIVYQNLLAQFEQQGQLVAP